MKEKTEVECCTGDSMHSLQYSPQSSRNEPPAGREDERTGRIYLRCSRCSENQDSVCIAGIRSVCVRPCRDTA